MFVRALSSACVRVFVNEFVYEGERVCGCVCACVHTCELTLAFAF